MDAIKIYDKLLKHFGKQYWWPAETPFEVIVKISTTPSPPPSVPKPEVVMPEAAEFIVSNISVTPNEVEPGELITISVLVTNVGGTQGSYAVVLNINGSEEARQEVTLGDDQNEVVTFTIGKETEGSYTVDIDGEIGRFIVTVMTPSTPEPIGEVAEVLPVQPSPNWWLIGGIIAGCFLFISSGLLVYSSLWREREKPRPV